MSVTKQPLVSIIVAVFNGVNTLQECIDSVIRQSYGNKELIIIDGGSNDGTVNLLKANDAGITYWLSEPDKGVYNAWNKGLSHAKGEWICFLGADDYFWDDQSLVRMMAILHEISPNVRLAYAQVMLVDAEGREIYSVGKSWEKTKQHFKRGVCLAHQGVMHRRGLFEQNGKFDDSFRIAGDYELMLRELVAAEAVFIPNIILTAMRQGGLSSNPANSIEAMRDIRRAQKMHGQNWPNTFWLMAMARVYLRLLLWRIFGEKMTKKLLDLSRRARGLQPYWTKL